MLGLEPFRPPVPERLMLPGPVGGIEAILETPAATRGEVALVCHPHPLYGGTLQNKVVHTSARALQEMGFATLRFNFRGVGASAGSFDDGRGETEDALCAADWLAERFPNADLTLVGFSFGSFVAYRVASKRHVRRLVTIAPPIRRFDFERFPVPNVPWVVIQGDRDELVDHDSVCAWAATARPSPVQVTVTGAEHFFHGRLNEVKAAIQDFVGA